MRRACQRRGEARRDLRGARVSAIGTLLPSRRDKAHKVSRLRNACGARHHHMTSTPLEESATSKPIAYSRLALTVMLALYAIPLMRHPEAGSFLDGLDLAIHETGHLVFAM